MTDYAKEYQKRNSKIWRRGRIWYLGVLPFLVDILLFSHLSTTPSVLFWLFFITLGLIAFYSACRIVIVFHKMRRCPKCEKIVAVSEFDESQIHYDFSVCPNCGARLK